MNCACVSGGRTSVTNRNEANATPRTGEGTRFQIAKKPGRSAIRWASNTVRANVQKTTVGIGDPAPGVGMNRRSNTLIAAAKLGARKKTRAMLNAKKVIATRKSVPGTDCKSVLSGPMSLVTVRYAR